MNSQHEACLQVCNDCAAACDQCAIACLAETETRTLRDCIRLSEETAAICRLLATFLARESRFVRELARVCAVVCDQCANECERYAADHFQLSGSLCRNCADECRRVVEAVSSSQTP